MKSGFFNKQIITCILGYACSNFKFFLLTNSKFKIKSTQFRCKMAWDIEIVNHRGRKANVIRH